MSSTNLFFTILAMGAVTFGLRLSLILLADKITIPELVQRGLKYVPPAVLSAIIFPDVLMPGGTLNVSLQNPYLLAAAAAVGVAWWRKNVFATMAVGMIVLWLTR